MIPAEFILGCVLASCGISLVVATLVMLSLIALRDGFSRELLHRGKWWIMAGTVVTGSGLGVASRFPPLPANAAHDEHPVQLELLELDSRPLVAAIRAHIQAHGEPPRSLDDLVPDFLSRVPRTGLRGYPDYSYCRYRDGRWNLCVWADDILFGLDDCPRFQHEPDTSRDIALRATLRSGDWIYVPN